MSEYSGPNLAKAHAVPSHDIAPYARICIPYTRGVRHDSKSRTRQA